MNGTDLMTGSHICLHKEKTVMTGRVKTASRWKWQQLEIVKTIVHLLASGMSLLCFQSTWTSASTAILLAKHPSSLPPPVTNESVPALTMRAITAAMETNQGRCFNLTGTQCRNPIPIEGGAGHECSHLACSYMQGRRWWCGQLSAECVRGQRMSKHVSM